MPKLQPRKLDVYPEGHVIGQEYPLEHICAGEESINAVILSFEYAIDLGLKAAVVSFKY